MLSQPISSPMARSASSPDTTSPSEYFTHLGPTPTSSNMGHKQQIHNPGGAHAQTPSSPHLHPISLPHSSPSPSPMQTPSSTHPRLPPALSLSSSLSPCSPGGTRRHARLPSLSTLDTVEHSENRLDALRSGLEEGEGDWDIAMPPDVVEGDVYMYESEGDREYRPTPPPSLPLTPNYTPPAISTPHVKSVGGEMAISATLPPISPPRHVYPTLHQSTSAPPLPTHSHAHSPIPDIYPNSYTPPHPQIHSPLATCAPLVSVSIQDDTNEREGIERARVRIPSASNGHRESRPRTTSPRSHAPPQAVTGLVDRTGDNGYRFESVGATGLDGANGTNGAKVMTGTRCETCTNCGAWKAGTEGSLGLDSLCAGMERF